MTAAATSVDTSDAGPSIRAWLGVFSLAFGAAIIVTTEFLPVGFLPNVAADLKVSIGVAGYMVLAPGLGAAVASPLVLVAARHARRRWLIVALGGLVVISNALAAVAPNFAVVLIARVFLGIAIGGFWAVVPPLGLRLVGARAGTRATSIILAGLSAGTVVGLPAGQLLGNLIGWRSTFAIAAAAAIFIVIAQWILLPGLPTDERTRFASLGRVFTVPIARTVLIAGSLITIGQFAASTFVTPFLLQLVHLGTDIATLSLLGYGAMGIVGTLLGTALVNRSKIGSLVGAAAAFGLVLIMLPALSSAPIGVVILFLVWGAIWGVVPLALQTLMFTATPDTPEASAAILMSLLQLSIAIGSALGGALIDSAGLVVLFVVAGAVAIGGALFALIARRGIGATAPVAGAR